MITEFRAHHVPAAAELVTGACRRQRSLTPLIAARLCDRASVEALVGASGVVGVACEERGTLTGFLAGWPLFGGLPGVYVPEWGHGAVEPQGYRDLYVAAAGCWEGRTVHAVTTFSVDDAAERVWHELGFGRVVTDRIRDLRPVGAGGVAVRPAVPGDGPAVADLRRRTSAYLAEPPVCRRGEFPESEASIDEALGASPGYVAFLASIDGEIAGFVDTAPAADDVPPTVSGPGIVRIGGAFTMPERRRSGVGAALLDALFAWARSEGYRACSLDHETANVAGGRFWEALGFTPVLHSVVRRVEPAA